MPAWLGDVHAEVAVTSTLYDQSHASVQIKAVAVSAPDWIAGRKGDGALNSSDPASLFNACRVAAAAANRPGDAWAVSNWSGGRNAARRNMLLMYSLDDLPAFRELIVRERPNLLLIGAMSLCMPGAISCAMMAREILGEEVLIVLGGRHPSETIYLQRPRNRSSADVKHHRASPGRLIRSKVIAPIFDIVLAGDGEAVIYQLGLLVGKFGAAAHSAIATYLPATTSGDWIADFPDLDLTIVSDNKPIAYDTIPPLADLFGVSAEFDVFPGRKTAHVFSDTGRGCVYDCAFCSERRRVTGGIKDINGAPRRLYNQLDAARRVIAQDHPGFQASAFVEDSIVLSGSPLAISGLCELMEEEPIDIVFGAQFTIDLILRRRELVQRLANNGLKYVFIGLETFDPEEIGGISKDLGGKTATWQSRFEEVLDILQEAEISCGCALLFGLGETHSSRIALLDQLERLRRHRRQPVTISANWAVQHPLCDIAESQHLDYLKWGTPRGPYLDIFHHFGEASLEYPISGVDAPHLSDLQEIVRKLRDI